MSVAICKFNFGAEVNWSLETITFVYFGLNLTRNKWRGKFSTSIEILLCTLPK